MRSTLTMTSKHPLFHYIARKKMLIVIFSRGI